MSLRISSIDLSRNLIATYRSTLFPIKNCVEHRKCFMQFYYIHTERLNYAFPRKISHRKSAFDPFFLQILKFPMHFLYIDFLLFMIQVFNHQQAKPGNHSLFSLFLLTIEQYKSELQYFLFTIHAKYTNVRYKCYNVLTNQFQVSSRDNNM